jgi:2-dehydropantoate 2-reductase
LAGPATTVLTLQNGLGNEEELSRLFAPEQIMGGLCFVCLNRLEPGVIHHLDHGQIILGEFQRWPEPRTHDIATMFRGAGVPVKVTDNLSRTHWEKLVWNIPFNGLGVAASAGLAALLTPGSKSQTAKALGSCLTTDQLLSNADWEQLVRELMLEIISAARALGLEIPESLADKQIERTRTMGAYKASTLIDFERGQRLELQSLFLEPLRLAQRASVPVPRLEALCSVLRQLDASIQKGQR